MTDKREESQRGLPDLAITVVGTGNMGEAIIKGMLSASVVPPSHLVATDVYEERLRQISDRYGVATSTDNALAASQANVLLLAVKPQQITEAIESIRESVNPDKLIISIAAGITTARIERELGFKARVVRVMPNTPAQIGACAAALARGRHATDRDMDTAEAILSAIGTTVRTEERHLDAVTALSGSGPAYVFLVAEAMIQSGIAVGLEPEISRQLAIQTVLGAAKLLAESGEAPDILRRKVTSPGGTTEAALKVMNEGRLVELFVEAVKAAARRSQELSTS